MLRTPSISTSHGRDRSVLLTDLALKYGVDRYARDFFHFYPVEPEQFWKPFSARLYDGVALAARQATFLHL